MTISHADQTIFSDERKYTNTFMLVDDRLTVDILFTCHAAGDDSRAVMLLMCGLIFTFLSCVHVTTFIHS